MLRRALDRLFAAAGHAAAACVLLIFVLMIAQSVGRGAGWRVGGINDLVSWLCAAAAFLAMAHAFKHGDFVRVTLLLEKLDEGPRRALETVALLIAAASTAYLAWWAASFAWDSYAFKEMAGGLVVIPIWIPQLSFVVGAVLLLLAVLDELWLVLTGRKPTYVRLVEERHARGDFSEDL
jgi:TRAP-type C4-dicarboxylate transport system permease small subunit